MTTPLSPYSISFSFFCVIQPLNDNLCRHPPAEHDLAVATLDDDGTEGGGDHGDGAADLNTAEGEVLDETVPTMNIDDPCTITGCEFNQLHAGCSSTIVWIFRVI
ncbi:MAG: hypothetical protein PHP59_10305 [Methanofollis sp.]|nr:hypothetical protein [Methanofollis sp.]MDD4255749.1 hypothetical protein [Methanofollis sp.]